MPRCSRGSTRSASPRRGRGTTSAPSTPSSPSRCGPRCRRRRAGRRHPPARFSPHRPRPRPASTSSARPADVRAMTTEQSKARSAARHGAGAALAAAPARAQRARSRRKAQLAAWGFIAPLVVYLGLFYAYPLYRNIDLSIRSYTLASFITGVAPFAGFSNYANVIESSTFAPALINTAIFVFVSIAFQFAIGLALAVFFFRRFRLSGILRALFLVPWLLPLLVSASTWSWMLDSDSGIVNSFLRAFGIGQVDWLTSPRWSLVAVLIANIWIGIPFNLVIMYSGLQSISPDVFEAAAIDGANGWQRFRRITFPLLRPVFG